MTKPRRPASAERRAALADARSGRIVYVAHCLLNENARYLGGAAAPGVHAGAVAPLAAAGYGLVQLPCPEFAAWGGPLKPLMWLGVGCLSGRGGRGGGRAAYRLLSCALPLFALWTRLVYRSIARRTARLAGSYHRAGYTVAGFVGVDGSPSCGVARRLSLGRSFGYLAGIDPARLDAARFNRGLYAAAAEAGQGIFMAELSKACRRTLGAAAAARLAWTAADLETELGVGAPEAAR
jgi:hypothetical protein